MGSPPIISGSFRRPCAFHRHQDRRQVVQPAREIARGEQQAVAVAQRILGDAPQVSPAG